MSLVAGARLGRGQGLWLLPILLVAALLGGFLAVAAPSDALLLLVGAAALAAVLLSVTARFAIVLFGGIFVFQSSSSVNLPKLGYLGLCLVSTVVSWLRVSDTRELAPWMAPYLRIMRALPLVALPVFVSYFVAHAQGTTATAWLRDIVVYALLALLVPIALDAGSNCSVERLVAIFVLAGGIAAVGFATDWLARRGVSALTLGGFSLASLALVAAPFAYALARVGLGPRRIRWLLYAVALIALVLVTGSRVGVVLLAAFIGIVGRRASGRVPLPRLAAIVPAIVVLVVAAVTLMGALAVANPHFLSERLASARMIITGNGGSDQSLQERKIEYGVARRVVQAHPVLGVGPGYGFSNVAEVARTHVTTVPDLDTPLATPAKFGWVGTGMLLAFLGVYLSAFRRARRTIGPNIALTAAGGFAMVVIFEAPFGDTLADKGFPLALMSLLALAVAESRRTLLAVPPDESD